MNILVSVHKTMIIVYILLGFNFESLTKHYINMYVLVNEKVYRPSNVKTILTR